MALNQSIIQEVLNREMVPGKRYKVKELIKLFEEIIFIASSLLELVILVFEISNSELMILTPPYKILLSSFGKERFLIIT